MANEQQNEEIRNILSQLQRQARDVTRELARCRGELGSKVRVGRQSALTLTELNKLSTGDINFYQPVGKMFMLKSRTSIEDGLKIKQKTAEEEVTKLISRIKSLEAEVEANQRALQEIVRSIDLESRTV
ncbi:hypothetical protein MJO28_000948 [Puccinia striiformis f. sp. tritici]|uniref:Uncharacterized protein n=1 Tax=Puccinia striiformis f. sp. tritici TaxID=168172 RepID=A0ACC0F172_9BASI|nr:hypothetical protein MJO28_000948 [Puccinia striiformis f. sp. tritici]